MKEAEIPKIYDSKKFEDKIYKDWENSGIFKPDKKAKGKPFSISMPPPNATGTLHLGHAVMLALEDIMTRVNRMKQNPTLWLPGTDHASIATENKVEKLLLEKTKKNKKEIGREKFLKEAEAYVAKSQDTIKNQMRKIGASCDWSRERYTLDKNLSKCVQEVFVKMYNDGLIYKGHRIVNWCTRCQSTLADDEVEYKEQYGKFYYLKYGPIVIGTARPETKVLDKTIIVHPNDKRYKKYIGKEIEVDWINGKIKANFIADKAADMKMGTGAMTLTPAHSFIDFKLAQKHNLEIIQIINQQGLLTENAGKFSGMNVIKARHEIVEKLKKNGLVEKIDENYIHNLSVCYRCGTPIEPLVSEQWFVNVEKPARVWKGKKQSLKQIAIDAVKSGDIKIIPNRFNKTYFQWMENLHDWCISRQIWFGHRIPAWYCQSCKKIKISSEKPVKCEDCKSCNIVQETDTLDTWFSSSLWTFSTLLDEPQKNENLDNWILRNKKKDSDLNLFHPTSVMETGYDILFFWVARMILMTTYVMGEVPFKKVYLHGLVRDKKGKKMSKSIGNGIDPLDMIKDYSADATRLSLVIGTAPGNDSRLYEEKISSYRNFINKIWNISRFILTSKIKTLDSKNINNHKHLTLADEWILSRLQSLISDVDRHFEQFEFSSAGEKIYYFLWHELADWYLEISKLQNNSVAPIVLLDAIKLLHPFTPFVTEKIYQEMKKKNIIENKEEFLAVSSWPQANPRLRKLKIESDFKEIQSLVTNLRDLRAKHSIPYSEKLDAAINTKNNKKLFQSQEEAIERLTKTRIQVVPSEPSKPEEYLRSHSSSFDIYLKISKKTKDEEEERLSKQRKNLENYISKIEAKLQNKSFIENAPKKIVEKEKQKLLEAKETLKKFKNHKI